MGIESPENSNWHFDMDFNEQLKTLREGRDLTQGKVAEMLGIAKNTYIGYEKGSTEPRLSELKKMSHLFGITLSELCMEADGRNVDQNLALQFEAVKLFGEDEMAVFNSLIEAMVIRHHAKKAQEMSQYQTVKQRNGFTMTTNEGDPTHQCAGKCGKKWWPVEMDGSVSKSGKPVCPNCGDAVKRI
jgi:transcriptional regulator with XRE-family HTH domain